MPDPERTNAAMNLPNREQRRRLMNQLRAEQEGRSIPGYAQYLQEMEALDTLMESLSVRDAWGAVPPLTAGTHRQLQEAIRRTAIAGETYLENVRQTAETDKSVSLKKGAPAAVNNLQGMLSSDYETLRHYDPAVPESLPVLLERSRTRTLILDGADMDSMGGNQNARIPVTIVRGDGKKYRGMFTKATKLDVASKLDEAVKEAAGDAETPDGAKEIGSLREKIRAYKKAHDLESEDDERVFIALAERNIVERNTRQWFNSEAFCRELGLDEEKIGQEAMKTFSRKTLSMTRNVQDMISMADLKLREGARLDSRNSAMSSVADMLSEPKLIAHAENMRFTDGSGQTMDGTIMDFSPGLDLNRDDEAFRQVNDAPFDGEDSWKALKQMADLQVIDYVCGNIDRHAGNMMYLTDKAGNIIGVQGIDNDSSFGNFANGKANRTRLSGTDDMTCISQSMAKKIMETDPHMLRFSLRGRGLSEQEINFSVKRLKDLKKAVKEGKEYYKDRPKIGEDPENAFDKGHLRIVSDEEFKKLKLKDLAADKGRTNIFTEVDSWYKKRLKRVREDDIKFDPKAWEKKKDKELPVMKTEGQKYTRETLLSSLDGASELAENGAFRIDDLTTKRRGGSQEFADMVTAVKELAKLKRSLAEEQAHGVSRLSAAEYESRRRRIEAAEEEARMTSQIYLAQKMSEKHVTTLDRLVGKNPYERARIEHAKRVFEHTQQFQNPPEATAELLAGDSGEALELKVSGELSAEEEARMAKEQLRRLHEEKGLDSPEEMRKMSGEAFNQALQDAAQRQNPGPQAGPAMP